MKLSKITVSLLSGLLFSACTVTPLDWQIASERCREHGGLKRVIASPSMHSAECNDGLYVLIYDNLKDAEGK